MSKKPNKSALISSLYNNHKLMFASNVLMNVLIIALVFWLSRYAKIKGDIFAMIIAGVVLIGLALNTLFLVAYAKDKKLFKQIFLGVSIFMMLFSLLTGIYIARAELSISNLVNQGGEETVDYSVIGFSEDYVEETMGEYSIGFLKQTSEFETLFKDKVREHSKTIHYIEYKDYNDLLAASLKNEIQYALVPSNYARLQDDYLDAEVKPFDKAHVLFTFSTVVNDDFNDVDVTTEPFSILLLGNNEGLSDSIILATVNPKTLRITMTSLARDSYVPIACYQNQSRDKLNHSRARGRQCLVDTVEDLLDLEIDFYFETDFYALQKIIDALGGLEIDSPVSFAGSFPIEGQPNEYEGVTVPKGLNLLDGKQAVTFARERHNIKGSDFGRQLNQQYVIREIATKLINERNPERLVSVLEGASNNLKMNISVNELTSLLGYAIHQTNTSPLDAMNTFRIVQTQVKGDTPTINGMSVVLPYASDIENARTVIKGNLKTKAELKDERSFTFSIRDPFSLAKAPESDGTTISPGEEVVPEPTTSFEVPAFTSGYTESNVRSWGDRKGVYISFSVIDPSSPEFNDSYYDGQIISQSISAGLYKEKPGGINLTIVSRPPEPEVPEPVEPEVPEVPEPVEPVEPGTPEIPEDPENTETPVEPPVTGEETPPGNDGAAGDNQPTPPPANPTVP